MGIGTEIIYPGGISPEIGKLTRNNVCTKWSCGRSFVGYWSPNILQCITLNVPPQAQNLYV